MREELREQISKLAAEAGAAQRRFENLGWRNYAGSYEELAAMDAEYELARTESEIAMARLADARKLAVWER